MSKLSVIVPSRNEPYLTKTINDILVKATGDIEVIVVLDGWKPDPPLKDDPRVKVVRHEESLGMRHAINSAAAVAQGEFIMKCDAHVMFGEGFDEILARDCEYDWTVVPSRYSLDADNWERSYGPIQYLYLTWPFVNDKQFGEGLHGKKHLGENGLGGLGKNDYYWMERQRAGIPIDDIMTWQGSCWFMHRQRFLDLGTMDTRFYNVYQEAQELGFKTWLSGGRLVVDKNTWMAHWHKGAGTQPDYGLSRKRKHENARLSTRYWMTDQWPGATRTIKWFVEKFWPIPGWPEDWEARIEREYAECPASTA